MAGRKHHEPVVVARADFQRLIDTLRDAGYHVLGPTARDGAIVYDRIASADELPAGWTDEQDGGTYRLKKRGDGALFGFAVGPQSWKQFLHPPKLTLMTAERAGRGWHVTGGPEDPPALAFLGVRACELNAIAIQDKVFLGGPFADPHYRARRERVFIVAANCIHAGGTCFCVSMNTGPRAASGYDIALTELAGDGPHRFVAEAGSERGEAVLRDVPHAAATPADLKAAERVVAETARHMGRSMETDGIKELFYRHMNDPHWDTVAARCLTCANCTMVCPTCFCTTVEDTTDLTGNRAERTRRWDSCFTMDFSYMHGGSARATPRARYRQWITHKLASWHDQFGSSGCVGCGRCITWCPVGIDITHEARALRAKDLAPAVSKGKEHGHGNQDA